MKINMFLILLSVFVLSHANALKIHCNYKTPSPYSITVTNEAPGMDPNNMQLFLFQVLHNGNEIERWASQHTDRA